MCFGKYVQLTFSGLFPPRFHASHIGADAKQRHQSEPSKEIYFWYTDMLYSLMTESTISISQCLRISITCRQTIQISRQQQQHRLHPLAIEFSIILHFCDGFEF